VNRISARMLEAGGRDGVCNDEEAAFRMPRNV
jgi:hypothetical protein